MFDATVSRSTYAGLQIVTDRRTQIRDVIVIQLGTNDGAIPGPYGDRGRQIMVRLQGIPLVVWLTIRQARSYYAGTNREMRLIVSAFPNAAVADWNAAAPAAGVYSDGLHLRPLGAEAMAGLADGLLQSWHDMAANRGGGACQPAIDQAVGG